MHGQSCYSQVVELLNKDSFPSSLNLYLWKFCLEGGGRQRDSLLFANNSTGSIISTAEENHVAVYAKPTATILSVVNN